MALKFPIFMDSQSTTPVDPRVVDAMIPYFTEKFGHPASRNHSFGWEAEGAVDRAREQIARLVGARDPKEVIFTSGGTESINLAIKGVAEMYREKGNHIVTTAIEQRASLDVGKRLERQGYEVTYVPVQPDGLVDVEAIRQAITDKTILISVMYANNEIGTIQDVTAIGRLAKEKGIIFHSDATQAVGKIPVNVETAGIDLLSCTAHLIYGPKGVGALYVRRKAPRVRIAPLIDGGGHERGMRSGTLPVPLIVGFGRAAEICGEVMGEEGARLAKLRDRLQDMIPERTPGAATAAQPEHLVRVCRGRIGADGAQQGERALVGLGLHVVDAGAVLRHRRARGERRARALLDPVQPAPVHHRGGNRARRRADDRGDQAAAGDVAALRAGERGRGFEVHPLEGRVRGAGDGL